mmetsp:Transcript_59924/g.185838  ORF Transcript_59924/g.185838 Transcript_59924/m.185838 type:complete len:785 (-) Transcript_59924:33-2387(-)
MCHWYSHPVFLVLASSAALACGGAPRHFPRGAYRSRAAVGWHALPQAASTAARGRHSLDVIFAVAQPGASAIVPALHRVSDPKSPDYGRHWRLDEGMAEALGARENARRVGAWLRAEGGAADVDATIAGDFVRARLPVARAEQLFGAPLRAFRHEATGAVRFFAPAGAPCSLPAALAGAVDFVSGLAPPRVRTPRPSPHDHARRHGLQRRSRGEAGQLEVLLVEARDRAFQVHVSMRLSGDLLGRVCGGGRAWPAAAGRCGAARNSSGPVRGFDAVAAPVRLNGQVQYVPPVHLQATVREGDCTLEDAGLEATQLACVVVVGPSLGLVNFAATRLALRAVFADGSVSLWANYSQLAYPALSATVSDVRKQYGVSPGYRNRAAGNSQAVANFLNNSASVDDALLFHAAMGMRRQPKVTLVGEGPNSVEGNIDLQWIQALGDNVETTSWTTPGGYAAHEPFLEWLVALANASRPPLVHSVSYGENEEEYTAEYQERCNLELAKLGLRGITVLVATGDTGVQGAAQPGGTPPRCAPFAAVWPASSPFVTAVGATMLSNHISQACNDDRVFAMGTDSAMPFACPETNVGEIVCSTGRGAMITSGGGFSGRFARPAYQDAAVAEYLQQVEGKLDPALFNSSGRAYPDISAIGQNVPIFFQGRLVMVGGTSTSSPIAAGIVAMLNGERLAEGLPPLGFFNPLLYATYARRPEIVQDVLVGNISGGNLLLPPGLDRNCPAGLPAVPGWDAATGLGSPSFQEMVRHLVLAPFRRGAAHAGAGGPTGESLEFV